MTDATLARWMALGRVLWFGALVAAGWCLAEWVFG